MRKTVPSIVPSASRVPRNGSCGMTRNVPTAIGFARAIIVLLLQIEVNTFSEYFESVFLIHKT